VYALPGKCSCLLSKLRLLRLESNLCFSSPIQIRLQPYTASSCSSTGQYTKKSHELCTIVCLHRFLVPLNKNMCKHVVGSSAAQPYTKWMAVDHSCIQLCMYSYHHRSGSMRKSRSKEARNTWILTLHAVWPRFVAFFLSRIDGFLIDTQKVHRCRTTLVNVQPSGCVIANGEVCCIAAVFEVLEVSSFHVANSPCFNMHKEVVRCGRCSCVELHVTRK
jgi:hypothetical protein